MAASCDLLDVDPPELQFPFELDKQISCPLKMTNKTDRTVAFKVKTTSPKKYCVRPNNGVVLPRSTCEVVVTMQAQTVAPPDLQCKDKFLVQSVVVGDGLSAKDITPQMFMKEEGNVVEEVRMRVAYVMPQESQSEIAEESDGPQRILVPMQRTLDNGRSASELSSGSVSLRSAELGTETRTYAGPGAQSLDLPALIAKLTEEKDSALEQNKKLRNELEQVTREASKQGGFSLLFVLVVGLLSIILGYLVKK